MQIQTITSTRKMGVCIIITDRSVIIVIAHVAAGFLAAEREAIMRVFMPDIVAFAPNVWIVEGPRVRDMGVMFTPHTVHVAEGAPATHRCTGGHAESGLGR